MKRRTQFFLQANGKVVADEMVTLRKSEVDKLIAEVNALRADKERLDWLAVSDTWVDVPATESFTPKTFRAAIDAARKDDPEINFGIRKEAQP